MLPLFVYINWLHQEEKVYHYCFSFIQDYVGAIDGTYIFANDHVEIQRKFQGRKEEIKNILWTITFDLKLTYVLVGWEESAHDSRVLGDALSNQVV